MRSINFSRLILLGFAIIIIGTITTITTRGDGQSENNNIDFGTGYPITGVTIKSIGQYKTTSYCSCPVCCGIWSEQHPSRIGTDYQQRTKSGTKPRSNNTIAADWSVLPAGTKVYIDGICYTVEDTGSAVKGQHIDIYQDSHDAARAWGIQYKEVFIVCESS